MSVKDARDTGHTAYIEEQEIVINGVKCIPSILCLDRSGQCGLLEMLHPFTTFLIFFSRRNLQYGCRLGLECFYLAQ